MNLRLVWAKQILVAVISVLAGDYPRDTATRGMGPEFFIVRRTQGLGGLIFIAPLGGWGRPGARPIAASGSASHCKMFHKSQ